jgi:membrane protease YdiL (CAAX protease family)
MTPDPQNVSASTHQDQDIRSPDRASEMVGGPAGSNSTPPRLRARLPGPGLFESLFWTAGAWLAQLAGAVVAGLLLVMIYVAAALPHKGADVTQALSKLPAELGDLVADNLLFFTAVTQVAVMLFAWSAVRLRLRPGGVRRLDWHCPSPGHALLAIVMVPPLALLCSELQQRVFGLAPAAERQMNELMTGLGDAPLSQLVLVVALLPALGEELLFRGLIGSGLVARWGVVRGIVLTSVLFGVAHLNPGQAIAVIPIGVALHYVYVTTRSLWLPVLMHVCNNALSLAALKSGGTFAMPLFEGHAAGPPARVLILAAALVTAVCLLFWQTRVRYVLRDGTVWNPGYDATGCPPPALAARAIGQSPERLLILNGVNCSLAFAAVLWPI